MLVTSEAEDRLPPSESGYHLGGWGEDVDTHDTQESQFRTAIEQSKPSFTIARREDG